MGNDRPRATWVDLETGQSITLDGPSVQRLNKVLQSYVLQVGRGLLPAPLVALAEIVAASERDNWRQSTTTGDTSRDDRRSAVQGAGVVPPTLSTADVARRVPCSTRTVQRWVAESSLPVVKVGGKRGFRFRPEEVDEWLRGR